MAEIITAPELSIRQYVASLNLNSDNVFYQRVKSNNVTTAGAQFQITSPNKRSLLLSYVAVDWQPTLTRTRGDAVPIVGADQNFDTSADQISFKPLMPFSNAMTSQTVSINGNSLTMSQPRRFQELMCRMAVTTEESRSCYESQWYRCAGGNYLSSRAGNSSLAEYTDEGLLQNESWLKTKLLKANGVNAGAAVTIGGGNSFKISYQEPLLVPPFNPFAKVGRNMPSYLPYGKMSPVIPNIDRFELSITFNPEKLAAGLLYYRYAHADTNNEVKSIRISALAADLLLYWYEVPTDVQIPRSVDLQSWNLREFQSPVNGGAAMPNGANATVQTLTDLIQLRSVPSYIILHCRRRQDAISYGAWSMISDDNLLGTGNAGSGTDAGVPQANTNHSLDSFLEIVSLDIVLGDRPNVISTQFTQRELYYLTVKNCKTAGFSLSYNDWIGPYTQQISPGAAAGADVNPLPVGTYNTNMSKCFIVLRPKDIAEKISPGVFFPTSLQFNVNVRSKDGFAGLQGGNLSYDLFTHVVVGKHFLRLEPDRAQYQEQAITIDAATAALKPGLVVPGLTGGNLSTLRDRAAAYQSRL